MLFSSFEDAGSDRPSKGGSSIGVHCCFDRVNAVRTGTWLLALECFLLCLVLDAKFWTSLCLGMDVKGARVSPPYWGLGDIVIADAVIPGRQIKRHIPELPRDQYPALPARRRHWVLCRLSSGLCRFDPLMCTAKGINMRTNQVTRTDDDIELLALSDHQWRVCDSRIELNDGFSLIGFIEKNGDVYELMEFADPVVFSFFTSLMDAVSHLITAPSNSTITLTNSVANMDPSL